MIKNNLRRRFFRIQHLNFSPDKIFPLLCPVREYDWIKHWNCEMIYSNSGFAEENCIFITEDSECESKDIWVVSKYVPPKEIQFVRTNKLRVIRYNITLKSEDNMTSTAEWEQIMTGLNEEGNNFVREQSEEKYNNMIDSLETMLNFYLEQGKMWLPDRDN